MIDFVEQEIRTTYCSGKSGPQQFIELLAGGPRLALAQVDYFYRQAGPIKLPRATRCPFDCHKIDPVFIYVAI